MAKKAFNFLTLSSMILALCLMLAAPQNAMASEKDPSKAIFAQGRGISSVDPYNALGTTTSMIKFYMFNGLTKRNVKGKVVCDLAESMTKVDKNTWEFKLKKGVKFHNGEPFNAQTVKFSFEMMNDPQYKFRLAKDFDFLKEIQIIDDHTVRLITKYPFAGLPLRCFNFTLLPPKYITEKGHDYFTKHPVGTGPYKLTKWLKGNKIILDAYDEYFEGAPAIDRVIYRVIPEDASRVAALEAGEVDLISAVPTSQIERLKANPDIKVVTAPTTRVIFIGLDTIHPKYPTSNKKFRQALNYAVDVPAIVKHIFNGNATRLATLIAPAFFGYSANVTPYEHNPEKAKALLKEIGYDSDQVLKLSVAPGAYINNTEVAHAIAGQLQKVGVNVQVAELENSVARTQLLTKKNNPLYLLGIGGHYNDADLITRIAFGTKQRYSTFYNKKFDELRMKAGSTLDDAKAEKAWEEVQVMLKEEAPAIFLYQQFDTYAYNKKLKNWTPRLDEMILLYGASLEK